MPFSPYGDLLCHDLTGPVDDATKLIHIRVPHVRELLRGFFAAPPASAVHENGLLEVRQFLRLSIHNALIRNADGSRNVPLRILLLRPHIDDHEAAIQEVTKAWVGDKVDENLSGITGVGGVFGDLINKALKELTGFGTDKVISSYLDVKNYVVCSVGRMSIGDNEEKMVSLGMFGHVFTFGKEDIENYLKQFFYEDAAKSYAESIYESNIGDPGMFLPYSVGLWKMWSLYQNTQKELGRKFNLKEYNRVILDAGECTFEMLEEKVNEFINKNK